MCEFQSDIYKCGHQDNWRITRMCIPAANNVFGICPKKLEECARERRFRDELCRTCKDHLAKRAQVALEKEMKDFDDSAKRFGRDMDKRDRWMRGPRS